MSCRCRSLCLVTLAFASLVGCSGVRTRPSVRNVTTLVFPSGFACEGEYMCKWTGPSDATARSVTAFARTESGECRTDGGRVDEATGRLILDEEDGVIRRVQSGLSVEPAPGDVICVRTNIDP